MTKYDKILYRFVKNSVNVKKSLSKLKINKN